jgi:hypothetical protein
MDTVKQRDHDKFFVPWQYTSVLAYVLSCSYSVQDAYCFTSYFCTVKRQSTCSKKFPAHLPFAWLYLIKVLYPKQEMR